LRRFPLLQCAGLTALLIGPLSAFGVRRLGGAFDSLASNDQMKMETEKW
jgi:hypothetical protein